VIDNFAYRVDSARSWTGILTPISYASSVGRAVGTDHALGSTTFVWVPIEIGQADARSRARDLAAHGVRATRRWLAGI